MDVKIKLSNGAVVPKYQSAGAAGCDLHALLTEPVVIQPGETALIPTGLFIEVPAGFEAQVRPRSGLAAKHSVTVLNSPGTIDSDYRGEVKVILINHGKQDFEVKNGERIAQIVFQKVEQAVFIEGELAQSARGHSGFGSSGK